MRVFVTGATGFIGLAVVQELLNAGHAVIGLARSEEAAKILTDLGAQPHIGSIQDLDVIRQGATGADAAVHLAFFHQISHMRLADRLHVLLGGSPGKIVSRFTATAVAAEIKAIETIGSSLNGSDRSLVAAFPTMGLPIDSVGTEEDFADPGSPGGGRVATEKAVLSLTKRGVRASLVRLPPCVHDIQRAGLVTRLIEIAKKKKVSAYIERGDNHWAAVHKLDATRLFRMALERGDAGSRYHAVAEEGIRLKHIAAYIGHQLDVPSVSITPHEARKHFGWLSPFVAADNMVSSELTRQRLNWTPIGPTLRSNLCKVMDSGNRDEH